MTKPWQKGLSGLNARIALPITTRRNSAKPDHGHAILVRLKPVSRLGDGVFMSRSRQSIFLLNMIPCSLKISRMLFERVRFFLYVLVRKSLFLSHSVRFRPIVCQDASFLYKPKQALCWCELVFQFITTKLSCVSSITQPFAPQYQLPFTPRG